ncbi:MAG: 2-oxoacid:acceptor oxidoreductase family protein [Dehalococcoidales bacterium]|nr:2-oxoacid:acceptor oxidoreductase family protein [Dehalococcoidales bacterium]
MANRYEIRLCGHGGQGIILAGRITAQGASIFDNKNATFVQDYGPEARGGACRADIIISDERVLYPYIDNPSVLVVMSQQAFDKYYLECHNNALVLIDKDLVKPKGMQDKTLLAIPARQIAEELGRAAVANIVMLGFFTAVTKMVSVGAMKDSILASVPKGTEDLNMDAFERGYAYGSEKLESNS